MQPEGNPRGGRGDAEEHGQPDELAVADAVEDGTDQGEDGQHGRDREADLDDRGDLHGLRLRGA